MSHTSSDGGTYVDSVNSISASSFLFDEDIVYHSNK